MSVRSCALQVTEGARPKDCPGAYECWGGAAVLSLTPPTFFLAGPGAGELKGWDEVAVMYLHLQGS